MKHSSYDILVPQSTLIATQVAARYNVAPMKTEPYMHHDGVRGIKFSFDHPVLEYLTIEEAKTCGLEVGKMPVQIGTKGHKKPTLGSFDPRTGELSWELVKHNESDHMETNPESYSDVLDLLGTAIQSALEWFEDAPPRKSETSLN